MNIIIVLIALALIPFWSCTEAQVNSSKKNRANELIAMDFFIGKWKDKEVQTDRDGNTYHFGMDMNWFDRKNTIIKMHIYGAYENSNNKTFWEGFKHWDGIENSMIYVGYSPDGRYAKGVVEFEGDNMVNTIYSGIAPNGQPVDIKDVATIINKNEFTTVTQVKFPGQDWRIVNEDHWVKVE